MYKYDDEVLKKLQHTEMKMLKSFDEICRKYNIDYFITFGTAIGAVRHGGFIPWDDDIDIGMMREDYEKLRRIPVSEWGTNELIDPMDDFGLHRTIYPRIYRKGTIFETEYHYKYSELKDKKDGTRLPIWLDIFVYDRIDSIKTVKRKLKKAFILRKLYYYSKCKINILKNDSFKMKVACFIKRAAFNLLNIVKEPEKKVYKAFLKLVTQNPGDYVTSFELDYNYETVKSLFKYDEMFPVTRIPFGGFEVSIQKNYRGMLESLYGNYMQLPPEEKRVNHPPAVLNFGDGEEAIDNYKE